jgi:hypothetical protein
MDAEVFLVETEKELAVFLDAIEAEWGFRPPVEVKVETFLRVSADFNIVGFAHEGQGVDVRDKNAHRRTPKAIARGIAQELVAHRNTCKECGTGTAPIYTRIYAAQSDLGGSSWQDAYVNRHRDQFGDSINLPPDGAERVVFPSLARKLDKLLAARAALPKIDDTAQRWMD